MTTPLSIVILAAGQGSRMLSDRPKVLHVLGGRSLLWHVCKAAGALAHNGIHVVYGHGGDAVPKAEAELPVQWAHQAEQAGTGHALAVALKQVPATSQVLVLYGDVPLVQPTTLEALLARHVSGGLTLLTALASDPSGYGRVVRHANGEVVRVVEEQDASAKERRIGEINTGILTAAAADLKYWLQQIRAENAQGEQYLTDCVALAVAAGRTVQAHPAGSPDEVCGVNDCVQLAAAERHYQWRVAQRLMQDGVRVCDPKRLDVRGEVTAARGVCIDVNVILEGRVQLGQDVRIGPHCLIRNAVLGDQVEILDHCVIEDAVIAPRCRIGPFARVRPGTDLGESVRVGNFVEIKNSSLAAGSKVAHLSYIGDSEVGRESNIGAGVITCNYDGAQKHKTSIGDRVFVGSDVQLVAPVRVGDEATIGAGTTVTRDVAPGELALSRVPQRAVPGWHRAKKSQDDEESSRDDVTDGDT